ncbi:hypothetical protein [Acidovorax sp. CF316]|uniref:hypothetical protein n=1 Tax=Acidovorax sp. CF316 TaxID=1144317 RepID=UPI0011B1DE4D|nr:hypothetical protein [Acidovorax sp. CF316]
MHINTHPIRLIGRRTHGFVKPASAAVVGGSVRVWSKTKTAKSRVRKQWNPAAGIPEETLRTFRKISDPANKHLFTVEAALKALENIKL